MTQRDRLWNERLTTEPLPDDVVRAVPFLRDYLRDRDEKRAIREFAPKEDHDD